MRPNKSFKADAFGAALTPTLAIMDKYHLHWFTDEVEVHTSIALRSYERLEQLLENEGTQQSREVWYALFSFLAHTAMVSKLLEPIGTELEKQERGKALKAHLQVEEDSPILLRAARDNLEHIDERIDGWVKRGESKVIEMVFDDRASYEYLLGRNGAVRRVIISDEMVFVSENRDGKRVETELRPVRDKLTELQVRCRHKLTRESPYTMIVPK